MSLLIFEDNTLTSFKYEKRGKLQVVSIKNAHSIRRSQPTTSKISSGKFKRTHAFTWGEDQENISRLFLHNLSSLAHMKLRRKAQ